MSLSESVKKVIDEIIHNYIQNISTKYDLDPNELLADWEGSTVKTTKKVNSVITNIPTDTDINYDDLSKYKKTELQDLCRKKGVKCSGTKDELVNLLLGKNSVESSAAPKAKAKAKSKTSSVEKEIEKAPVVLIQLQSKIPNIPIRRNQYGNHEHAETSFIFDKKTKKVIGKQNKNGTIDVLTKNDIEMCHKMKFTFELPKNLDKKSDLGHVKVDELDEEFEEEEDDEILADEEELDEDDLIEEEEEEGEEDFEEDFEEDYE